MGQNYSAPNPLSEWQTFADADGLRADVAIVRMFGS